MASNDLSLKVLLEVRDKALAPLMAIAKGNDKLVAGLTATQEQLNKLAGQQKAISSLNKLQAQYKEAGNSVSVARAQLTMLQTQLPATAKEQRAHAAAVKKAENALAQATGVQDRFRQRLVSTRAELNKMGVGNLSKAQGQLPGQIEKATAALQRQEVALQRLGKARAAHATAMKRGTMAGALGVAGVMAGRRVAGGLGSVMGTYSEQENASSDLRSAMMLADGSVSPEFEKINQLAQRLGDRLPGTTADFVNMMTVLRQQGISAQAVLGGTGEAAAYLGVQLRMPVTEAAEFAAKMQDATRTTEADMMGLMDTIQRARYAGVDSSNMLQGFTKLAPVLSIIRKEGLEASNMLAPMLVMFDQAGMRGEAAGNAVRKVLQGAMDAKKMGKGNNLLAPGQRLNFTDGKGEFGGFEQMFRELGKLQGLTTEKRLSVMKAIFGDDAETMQVLDILMSKGLQGYQASVAKMAEQADLQTRVSAELGTMANVWEATQGTFTNVIASLGEALAPQAKAASEWLAEMGVKLGGWIKENPTAVKWIMLTVAGLSALLVVGGALLSVGAMIYMNMMALKVTMALFAAKTAAAGAAAATAAPALGLLYRPFFMLGRAWSVALPWVIKLGGALMWLGRLALGALLTPMGLVVAGVAAAVFLIWKHWDTLGPKVAAVWASIKAWWNDGMAWLASMPARMAQAGAAIMAGLANGIRNGLGAARDAIVGAGDAVVGWFKEKLGIRSPSRVFMQLGGWVSEGAALGIAGKAPMVARAAAAMAALPAMAAAPAIGSAGPVAAAAPAAYTITINAAPGQDPQAIARAVAAELDRRERARAARGMSMLTDR